MTLLSTIRGLVVDASGGGGSGVTNADSIGLFAAAPDSGTLHYDKNTKALYLFDGAEYDRVFSGPDEVLTFDSSLAATTDISTNDSDVTLRIVAADAEGFPITYSFDMTPSNPIQLDSAVSVIDSSTSSAGIFHIRPSSYKHAGAFTFRGIATDGVHKISSSTVVTLANAWVNSYYAVDFTENSASVIGSSPDITASDLTGSLSSHSSGWYHMAGTSSSYFGFSGLQAKVINQSFTYIVHLEDGKWWTATNDFAVATNPHRFQFHMGGGNLMYRDQIGNSTDINITRLTGSAGAVNNSSQTTLHDQGSTDGWGSVLVMKATAGDAALHLQEYNALTGAKVAGDGTIADDNYGAGGVAGPDGDNSGKVYLGLHTGKGGYQADEYGGKYRQAAFYTSELSDAEITQLVIDNISGKVT